MTQMYTCLRHDVMFRKEHSRSFHSVAEHQFHNGWGLQILPNGDYPLGCFTRMKSLGLSLGMNDR